MIFDDDFILESPCDCGWSDCNACGQSTGLYDDDWFQRAKLELERRLEIFIGKKVTMETASEIEAVIEKWKKEWLQ